MIEPDYEPRLSDHGGDMSKRWFIDYRIWDTDKQDFIRKQYTGMNKYRTLRERRRVSKEKLAEIKKLISAGYTAGKTPVANIGLDIRRASVADAVKHVRDVKQLRRGKEEFSRLLKRLGEYPELGGMPVRFVQPVHVAAFAEFLNRRNIGPKTFNNYRDTLSSVFVYLTKMELVPRNPCRAVDRRRVAPSPMHRPYSEAQRAAIRAELERRGNKQMLLFIAFIYYCFIRSGGELRLLRVGDIHAKTILVPAGRAKNDKSEHVAIPPQLEKLIQQHGLRDYPADHFVFTHAGTPGTENVGPNWFPLKHRALLLDIGITDKAYTMYGYKHTGAINLYLATQNIDLVRRHCRHAHAGITAKYLRTLGVLTDSAELEAMPTF